MSSKPATGECTAHDRNSNEECDCVEYVESEELEDYCDNCYHRLQHHLASKPGASKKRSGVNALLAGILGGAPSGKGTVSKPRASSSSSSLAAFASSSSKRLGKLTTAANKEANQGMRPLSDGPSKSKLKGKEKAGKRNSSGTYFKVVSVFVVAAGTEFVNESLQIVDGSDKLPNRVDIQNAELEGLAVVNANGIDFDRTASHEDVITHFLDLLPLMPGNDEPTWYLAAPVGRKLVIVPSAHPDGAVLDFNKGNGTTGFRNNHLFIGEFSLDDFVRFYW
ncbi:hypothetical protein DFH09DRAFT_1107512 [Mycena vulgaris]|nr:hypothetical protein DFH09DRAFT_1107512 [Mycena vulgaris]